MDDDVKRLVRRQRGNQRGADPARIDDRHAGMKADDGKVRDRFEAADDRGDPARRQQERVAAGDDDLPDLGMLRDIAEGAVERRRREQSVALADLLAAEAEAAIDRADEDRLQEHAVGVAMDEAGQRRPAFVADRVGLVVRRGVEFGGARHELRRDRIGGVGGVDQRRHLVGHGDRELCGDPAQLGSRSGATRPRATRSSV